VSIEPLFEAGPDPMRVVGRWVDLVCPLPEAAIIKSPWRITALQNQLDLSGPTGKQVLILAGALFPGPDLTRLASQHFGVHGFSQADVTHPALHAMIQFADARWRMAQRAYAAWMLMHMAPPILEPLREYPVPGSQG
jgi:hypothetical protein